MFKGCTTAMCPACADRLLPLLAKLMQLDHEIDAVELMFNNSSGGVSIGAQKMLDAMVFELLEGCAKANSWLVECEKCKHLAE